MERSHSSSDKASYTESNNMELDKTTKAKHSLEATIVRAEETTIVASHETCESGPVDKSKSGTAAIGGAV